MKPSVASGAAFAHPHNVTIRRVCFVVIVCAAACTSDTSEHTGRSTAAFSVAIGPNVPAVLMNMHYASVVAAKDPGAGVWHWVVAFDNISDGTPNVPPAMLISNTGGGSWIVDPSLYSPYYVSQPEGGFDVDQPCVTSNPAPPYSTFVSWNNATSNTPMQLGYIASINNVTFQPSSSSSAPGTWDANTLTGNANTPKRIEAFAGALRPKIAVSTIPWNTGTNGCNMGNATHELVWVAWSTALIGRPCDSLVTSVTLDVTWKMTVFDNSDDGYGNAWSSVIVPLGEDPQWPLCIGTGEVEPSQTHNPRQSNNAEPHLAATGSFAAVAHNQWTALGTRILVYHVTAACKNNGLVVSESPVSINQSPDPCYDIGGFGWCPPGHTGPNGPNGTNVLNDQWGAQIAFQFDGSTPETLVTFYSTAEDENQSVAVYAAMGSHGGLGGPIGNAFSDGTSTTVYRLSNPGVGEVVPWDDTIATWFDYQGIGVDPSTQSFLAAWGGDGRLVSGGGQSGVFTSHITTTVP